MEEYEISTDDMRRMVLIAALNVFDAHRLLSRQTRDDVASAIAREFARALSERVSEALPSLDESP